MNGTIMNNLIYMKTKLLMLLFVCHVAACQDSNILSNYPNSNCAYNEFGASLWNSMRNSLTDSIPISSYNSFMGESKIYHLKNDVKKRYSSIGKISDKALIVNGQKITTKIFPICKVQHAQFTNIYTLTYSAGIARIELIVLNSKDEIISGIVLLKGEVDYSNKKLVSEQIKTTIQDGMYIQDRTSETPEGDKFQRTFVQRIDGYFEEILQ